MSIDKAKQATAIVQTIKPHLAGLDPALQGAILCELLALWIAGHSPVIREDMLAMHVRAVDEMVPICEEELFGDEGHPDTRTRQ